MNRIARSLFFRLLRAGNLKHSSKKLHCSLFLIFFILLLNDVTFSQVIPTKGKDFWLGFPYNPQFYTRRCEVFITSTVNTSGTIAIPKQAWSQPFTVLANQTTTITLSIPQVEHTTSDVVENKGVQITSLDTVSVFAISFQDYSSDATVVYPKQSLGTEYRVGSYTGVQWSALPKLNSDLLVVATEDGTQVEITPTSNTLGGHVAGVPFTVNLDAGESYQLIAALYSDDLTGTLIKGTDSSGSCRPFAVFSGVVCSYIPQGCTACDIIYEQALPTGYWGKTYYAVPFSFASSYSLRIMADQNATTYAINGVPGFLGAGQYITINGATGTRCITANKPICVIQYMEGVSCAGAGDPSMMYLNAEEQKIDKVTFSTITSTVITQHDVNVVMRTSHISQLKLDGINVPAAAFSTLANCATMSYAQLPLAQGSHTLEADSGFTAYVYGTGSAESYAYSVGSFSKAQPIIVDSILCSSDTIHIGATSVLYGTWWSTSTNPTDTIGFGQVLTLVPPIVPDVYIQHGMQSISGCETEYYFNVEIPDPPQTVITQVASTLCQTQLVQLNVSTIPSSSSYQYSWTPTTGLNNPNIANPVATASASMWYYVDISSPNGCTPVVRDSVYLNVFPLPLPTPNAGSNQTVCQGTPVNLSATGGLTYLWTPGGLTTSAITVTPSTTTNYIVSVTDANGCGNSDTVLVTVVPAPVANAGADQTSCAGSNVTLTATGGGTYLWNPGGSTNASITVAPAVPTNYVVQVSNAAGCTATDSVYVNVSALPAANAGVDQAICTGGSATLLATGGVSYLWTPGGATTSSITVNPVITTNYIVKVTDANGCENTDTVQVTVNTMPVAYAGLNQSICSGVQATLTATGGTSYMWYPGGLAGSSITVNPATNTSYWVIATDANGCTDTDTVLVTVNQSPFAYAGINQTLCTGQSATLTASGGGSYVWTPGGSTSNTITVSPVTTSSYSVLVTNASGCTDTDTVTVIINPLPAASAGVNQSICVGSSATLTAAGGTSYVWNPGGFTTNSITVSPVTTSSYIVEVTDSNSCKNTDTVVVTVNLLPAANAGIDKTICSGSSTLLTATGGASYIWSQGGNTSSISVSPVTGTTYVVTVTSSFGCTNTDTVYVAVNTSPVVSLGADKVICMGDSVILSSSIVAVTYQWTPGGAASSAITVSPSVTSTYSIIVTDVNGCTGRDTARVIVNPLPVVNAGTNQFICTGYFANLSSSTGVSYYWMPGGFTTQNITVTPVNTTSYSVEVTDSNGCKNSDSVLVTVRQLISGTSYSHAICIGNSITLSDTGGISYSWYPGGSTNDSITVSPQSNSTYIVYINAPNGCLVYDTMHVAVNPLPAANAGNDHAICKGQSTLLSATGGTSYFWITTNQAGASVSVSPAASTNYIVSVTDANGCVNTDSVFVTVNLLPVVSAGLDKQICPKDSTTLVASGALTYLWTPGGATNASVNVSPAVVTNYIVEGTDGNGCKNSDTVNVSFNPVPIALMNFSSPVCEKSSLPFNDISTISSGTIAQSIWTFGDGQSALITNPSHTYNTWGSYTVQLIVISDKGCKDTTAQQLYINASPIINFSNSDDCVWQPVQFNDLTVVPNGSISNWLWQFGDGSSDSTSNPLHAFANSGNYNVSLSVTSDSGCTTTFVKADAIYIYPLPDAHFIATPPEVSILYPTIKFVDQSSGGATWKWDFGDNIGTSSAQNPIYIYGDTGLFTVQMILTSSYGCLDTTYGEVYVMPTLTIYFPNSFTPDADGRNDYWHPVGIGISNLKYSIYNRWGNEIFNTSDLTKGWDGMNKGIACQQGVYVFKASATDYKGIKRDYTGVITLLK